MKQKEEKKKRKPTTRSSLSRTTKGQSVAVDEGQQDAQLRRSKLEVDSIRWMEK